MLVHRYLELACQGWEEAAIRRQLACAPEQYEAVRQTARRLLETPGLGRFFHPACHRAARTEMEVVGPDGALWRIDRLVEFEDAVWVLDYKMGGLSEPDLARRAAPYLEQLAGYRRAAAALYPGRPVHAGLIFADGAFYVIPE